jgi:hypothetical protein
MRANNLDILDTKTSGSIVVWDLLILCGRVIGNCTGIHSTLIPSSVTSYTHGPDERLQVKEAVDHIEDSFQTLVNIKDNLIDLSGAKHAGYTASRPVYANGVSHVTDRENPGLPLTIPLSRNRISNPAILNRLDRNKQEIEECTEAVSDVMFQASGLHSIINASCTKLLLEMVNVTTGAPKAIKNPIQEIRHLADMLTEAVNAMDQTLKKHQTNAKRRKSYSEKQSAATAGTSQDEPSAPVTPPITKVRQERSVNTMNHMLHNYSKLQKPRRRAVTTLIVKKQTRQTTASTRSQITANSTLNRSDETLQDLNDTPIVQETTVHVKRKVPKTSTITSPHDATVDSDHYMTSAITHKSPSNSATDSISNLSSLSSFHSSDSISYLEGLITNVNTNLNDMRVDNTSQDAHDSNTLDNLGEDMADNSDEIQKETQDTTDQAMCAEIETWLNNPDNFGQTLPLTVQNEVVDETDSPNTEPSNMVLNLNTFSSPPNLWETPIMDLPLVNPFDDIPPKLTKEPGIVTPANSSDASDSPPILDSIYTNWTNMDISSWTNADFSLIADPSNERVLDRLLQ